MTIEEEDLGYGIGAMAQINYEDMDSIDGEHP